MPAYTSPLMQLFIAGYGMGAESTAFLHSVLTGARTLPDKILPDFSNLVICTAQTGDEWSLTGELVTEHILPLIRRHNVRFVEVARKGPAKRDGVEVLQDTRSPTRLHLDGVYKLSDENRASGTMPILSGHHTCAQKSKGTPLDSWRDQEFGNAPYYHAIGYNVEEESRMRADKGYSMGGRRTPVYPISDWEMTRGACVDYLYNALVDDKGEPLGIVWPKSCCRQCPYINLAGWPHQLQLFLDRPREAMQHVVDEYVTLAFNPRSGLYGPGRSLIGRLQRDGAKEVIRLAYARMTAVPWGLYRIRRRYNAPADAPRSVQRLMIGSRNAMMSALGDIADYSGLGLSWDEPIKGAPKKLGDTDKFRRLWVKRRTENVYPSLEEFLVIAPAQVEDKARTTFDENWAEIADPDPLLIRRERNVGCAINVVASMTGDTRRRDKFGVVLTDRAA